MKSHWLNRVWIHFIILSCCLIGSPVAAEVYSAHTRVELVSEYSSVPEGGVLWLGLLMTMDEGWHVYWRNPGDSGMAPSFSWGLPEGLEAGDIQWPYPQRISAGPLTSFGYEGRVLLAVPLRVLPGADLSSSVDIRLHVSWLACKVDCIPGQADLILTLPAAGAGKLPQLSDEAFLFKMARSSWPVPDDRMVQGIDVSPGGWIWRFQPSFLKEGDVFFFPLRNDLIDHAADQVLSPGKDAWRLLVRRSQVNRDLPAQLEGVLVHEGGWDPQGAVKAVSVMVPVGEGPLKTAGTPLGWGLAVLFAFLGGIILNGMPCVLPILSIKVLQVLQRSTDRARALMHAGFFTLGILVSFWGLAILLFALQAAGHAVGWGFQFQSPVFVGVIAAVLFVFALNLFGLFEFSFYASGPRRTGSGKGGAFLSGVFMTVVATPCTAPFMGSALGFALAQPWIMGLLVFTFLGLGLAVPMVLLTAFPALMRFIPRPGPWMITLKQFLGFVLMGCVIWLLSVLGEQAGVGAIVTGAAGLLLVAFSLWLLGKGHGRLALIVFLATVAGAYFFFTPHSGEQGIAWQDYDAVKILQARAEGKPVFIDFTAAWCLTCKVNDLTALRHPAVVKAFRERRIEAFLADWTSQDPDITKALGSFGRNSVPLYVYYAPGAEEPRLLPEILTTGIVLDALQ